MRGGWPGLYRIYHFRGFALHVTLSRLPPAISSENREPWTASGERLERHGVLWIAHQSPIVIIDGVSDGKERIGAVPGWHATRRSRINAAMQKQPGQRLAPRLRFAVCPRLKPALNVWKVAVQVPGRARS